jgi:glycosyltransferase involved in cell wall biosynthesis
MPFELWIAGYPSFLGGADVELDHNIDLWRSFNVEVNLVPMFGKDAAMESLCRERGCHTHEYQPHIFQNKVVLSYCNGSFLERLPEIYAAGPPAAVIWFNCMTWAFDAELEAQRHGWLTYHGFISDYQRRHLLPKLKECGRPVRTFDGYLPHFNLENHSQKIEFQYRPPSKWYGVGRVSRDDAGKYSADMWSIFNKVCAPIPTKAFVLGYGPHADGKCGPAPPGLDWQTWSPHEIPVRTLFENLHCMIHKTGGSRESFCRVILEAAAFGVPVVVENDYAFPELIVNGETGFLCDSSAEMSFRASQLAFDEELRSRIINQAREQLFKRFANRDECWAPWLRLLSEIGRTKKPQK